MLHHLLLMPHANQTLFQDQTKFSTLSVLFFGIQLNHQQSVLSILENFPMTFTKRQVAITMLAGAAMLP